MDKWSHNVRGTKARGVTRVHPTEVILEFAFGAWASNSWMNSLSSFVPASDALTANDTGKGWRGQSAELELHMCEQCMSVANLAQGRSVQHTCVRSALADITIVAFRLLVALRATASLSWRGLHSYLRAEQQ